MSFTDTMVAEVAELYRRTSEKENAARFGAACDGPAPPAFVPTAAEMAELRRLEAALPAVYVTFDPPFDSATMAVESATEAPPGRRYYRPSALVHAMRDGDLLGNLHFAPLRPAAFVSITIEVEQQLKYALPFVLPNRRRAPAAPPPDIIYSWGNLVRATPAAGGALWRGVAYVWAEGRVVRGGVDVSGLLLCQDGQGLAAKGLEATNTRVFLLNPLARLAAGAAGDWTGTAEPV